MKIATQKTLRGFDLFAGAGGLSLGASLAGVDVTHAIEKDPDAAATYALNHTNTEIWQGDIRNVKTIPKTLPRTDILFAGPPCQGFSTSNQRTRNLENENNWLLEEVFRFTKLLNPNWVIIENVSGLRTTSKGAFNDLIFDSLEKLRYNIVLWELSADDYGVPQKRRRLFYVGSRQGFEPVCPPTTNEKLTVRQAISDLPNLAVGANVDNLPYKISNCSKYARSLRNNFDSCSGHLVTNNSDLVRNRYAYIPEGGNWQNIPPELMQNYSNLKNGRSRHTGIYRRLCWNEPSVVIANYRKNMLVHPSQDRGLSVREACRIQSFPDNYDFSGSIGKRQQQVSNSVPPFLAEKVFAQIVGS